MAYVTSYDYDKDMDNKMFHEFQAISGKINRSSVIKTRKDSKIKFNTILATPIVMYSRKLE